MKMTHPTFPLYGYERFFAMDPDTSTKIAHIVTLRGNIPTLLQHLPEAILQTFNRHPKMRAVILPGTSPQKVMICAPFADVSELKHIFTVHNCSIDEEEHAEQARNDAAIDDSYVSNNAFPPKASQLRWMESVQAECEEPVDRIKDFPFSIVCRIDNSAKTFARLILFADHYMSDVVSGGVILGEILQSIAGLSGSSSVKLPSQLPLRQSLYQATHYVNPVMSVIHEAVSKYVMQPLVNFDTDAFVPFLPIQKESQRDFRGSPPNPRNESFGLFAQGCEAAMRSAIARCKDKNVSVQGAIVAAMTMAFGLTKFNGKLSECTEPLQLRLDIMSDMREKVAISPVKHESLDASMEQASETPVGLYSSPISLVFITSEGIDPHRMSFWDVARKADLELECAVLGHELKMQSMFVNEMLNAEKRADTGLNVANCALNDITISYLDYSDTTASSFPSELALGNDNDIVTVEDLHVYTSYPSLSSTSKVVVTALSHFNYAMMYKLEPTISQKLFGWMVQCIERIGEYCEQDTFAQAADRLTHSVLRGHSQ